MRTLSTAAAIALSVGLVSGVLAGYGGAAGPDVGRPAAAVAAVKHKTKVPGHQIRIVLAGNRLGQSAKIRLVGVKGRADGVTKVVKVKTTKRVKHLRSGGYRLIPRTITTPAGRATAKPVKVTVTAHRGATARIVYVFTRTRVPPDTTAPGPVTGLTVGDRTPTSIALSWTNPTDADLAEVIARRAKGTAAPGSASEGTGVSLGSPTAATVTDAGLDPSTQYSYAVFTRDTAGNTSSPTTVVATTSPPEPIQPQTITAGIVHTCGLDVEGKAWCWGGGSSGQLGDGNADDHETGTPVSVVGGHTFTSLTARWYRTCGLDDAGNAWCWGDAKFGVLGDGTTSDHETGTPVAVVGGHTFSQLAAGYEHSCGLDGAGKAWCWGRGEGGPLGDGNTSDHETGTPVSVVGGHTFTSLTAGEFRTCGLDNAGNAWCWGRGEEGPLGDGNTSDHETGTPVAVVGSHTFTSLTAGRYHTCGIDGAGKAWCWGYGGRGILGDGNVTSHSTGTPVEVVGGHTLTQFAGGGWWHTCALDDAGKAWCWGLGPYGQLGDGNTSDHETGTPVEVVGGHTLTQLAAGINHTCALDSAGKAWCWGYGQWGMLGDGNTNDHETGTPVEVMDGHTFAQP